MLGYDYGIWLLWLLTVAKVFLLFVCLGVFFVGLFVLKCYHLTSEKSMSNSSKYRCVVVLRGTCLLGSLMHVSHSLRGTPVMKLQQMQNTDLISSDLHD